MSVLFFKQLDTETGITLVSHTRVSLIIGGDKNDVGRGFFLFSRRSCGVINKHKGPRTQHNMTPTIEHHLIATQSPHEKLSCPNPIKFFFVVSLGCIGTDLWPI